MFLINFPAWLTALYTTLVKPFLNARVSSKIEILAKGNYGPLLEMVAADQLPDFIPGGTVQTGMPALPQNGRPRELDKDWRAQVEWPPSRMPGDSPHLPWNQEEILQQIRDLGGVKAAWEHVFKQARDAA